MCFIILFLRKKCLFFLLIDFSHTVKVAFCLFLAANLSLLLQKCFLNSVTFTGLPDRFLEKLAGIIFILEKKVSMLIFSIIEEVRILSKVFEVKNQYMNTNSIVNRLLTRITMVTNVNNRTKINTITTYISHCLEFLEANSLVMFESGDIA